MTEKTFNSSYHIDNSSSNGTLTLVATPIGNLLDISQRALNTLMKTDVILCEDTRVTQKLLQNFKISKPLYSFHDHNEAQKIPHIMSMIKQGKNIALVSDAGMPVFSDPGYRLVNAIIENGFTVTAIPGPNAAITSLALSGLPPIPFLFNGFMGRAKKRFNDLTELHGMEQNGLKATIGWYESPHRIYETLSDMEKIFGGERQAVIVRELTKKFEEILRLPLHDMKKHFSENKARGEITLFLAPAEPQKIDQENIDQTISKTLLTHSVKDTANLIAKSFNLPKKIIYKKTLDISNQINHHQKS